MTADIDIDNESDTGGGERLRRWRMVLGGAGADGTGHTLSGTDAAMDSALAALYGADRGGGRDGRMDGGARRLRAVRGALARRHPYVLPELRRPGHAA